MYIYSNSYLKSLKVGGGFQSSAELWVQQHWTGKDDAQEIKIFLAATHIENESRGQGINCFFRGTAN